MDEWIVIDWLNRELLVVIIVVVCVCYVMLFDVGN